MNTDTQFLDAIKSLPEKAIVESIIEINKTDDPDIKKCTYKVEIEYTSQLSFNDDTKLLGEICQELENKVDEEKRTLKRIMKNPVPLVTDDGCNWYIKNNN